MHGIENRRSKHNNFCGILTSAVEKSLLRFTDELDFCLEDEKNFICG